MLLERHGFLGAALASAPGLVMGATIARSSSRMASRIGYRRVLIAGAAAW